MTVKGIEALEAIRDNMTVLIEELKNMSSQSDVPAEETTVPAVEEETAIAPKTAKKTSRKAKEESETIPSADELTEEKLNALSYNNLKKLAKDMGIAATGARDELTQKILAHQNEAPATEEEPETPVVEKTSTKKTSRNTKKVEEPETVEEPEDEDEDPIVAKVNEAVAEMSNEEIANLLTEVGVRAKGKRQALIAAVIKAVQEGKIDLDDDEEDETDETESEEEFDVNDPENPDMTEERRAALEAHQSEVETDFDEGTITRAQIVEWLNEFKGTKDTMKKKSDDELVAEYIYCSSLLINDEGEMIEEEGAYTINGIPYCCGHQLAYNEDDGVYICESCGAEYEAEEE